MRKTKLSKVLALTLVLLMVMSTTVFGATGDIISNKLNATFSITGATQANNLIVTASTRDAGTSTETDKGGYGVELSFTDLTKMQELTKLEVSLYRDTTQLVSNSLAMDRIDDNTKIATSVSCPFNIGTPGNNQWAWNRGAFPITEPLDESEVPNRVIVNYEKAGVQYTYTKEVELKLPVQQAKNLSISATTRDAGTSTETDKGGYGVELSFTDLTQMQELTKLEVSLYRDTNQLVSNSLAMSRIDDKTKIATSVSCPFNIGTLGNNQWAWDRGAFPITEPLDESEVPNRVIVNYEKAGVQYTYIHAVTLTLPKQIEKQPVVLTWDLGANLISAEVGQQQKATIKATLNESLSMNAKLVVEIKDENGLEVGDVILNIGDGQISQNNTTLTFTSTNINIVNGSEIGLEITFNVAGTYNISAYLIEADAQ